MLFLMLFSMPMLPHREKLFFPTFEIVRRDMVSFPTNLQPMPFFVLEEPRLYVVKEPPNERKAYHSMPKPRLSFSRFYFVRIDD